MNILFVCKHNRFRSKVAEAIFNKLNKNKNIKIKSAGVKLDLERPYVENIVKEILAEKNYFIKEDKPHWVDSKLIKWADKIVVVANNVSSELFPKEKTIVWEISDADVSEIYKIRRIINEIEVKVKRLVGETKL